MTKDAFRVDSRRSNIGVVGDHARVEGGIHHYHERARRASVQEYAPPSLPDPDILASPGPLPPGSCIPFIRNKLFTGRVEALKSLAGVFLRDDHPLGAVVQVIHGMGGVGKSQLVVEFAWRYGRFFHGVHWLDASRPEALDSEVVACGRRMCLHGWPSEQPDQVARTLREWEQRNQRLVVFDSLNDFVAARRWLARLHSAPIDILITSRRSDWPSDLAVQTVHLDVWSAPESYEFLRRHLKEAQASDADLQRLATRVGHLPLALELARRYLNHMPTVSVADHLDQMESVGTHPAMQRWRADRGSPTGHTLDLTDTFALSWRQVSDEVARRVFLMSGYCAPSRVIPLSVFERAIGDRELCHSALDLLTGLGLLGRVGDVGGYAIHPLLSEYARRQDGASRVLPALSSALTELAREANRTGIPGRFAPLYPHAKAVASAAEKAEVEYAVHLLDNIGYYLNMIADWEEAEEACSRAVALAETIFGAHRPEVATCVTTLGWVLQGRGDLDKALECYQRALNIDEAAFGPSNHVHIARDLRNIGDIHKAQGNLKEAQRYIEQALEVSWNLPEAHRAKSVAHNANSLGWLLKDRSKLLEAKVCFEEALEETESQLGSSHPDVATCCVNVGLILKEERKPSQALEYFDRALEVDQEVFGRVHPKIARDLSNKGWARKDLGDLEKAHRCFERALEVMETYFGPDHTDVTSSLVDLGWILKDLGNVDQALSYFRRALSINKAAYGSDDLSVAHDLNRIGILLHDQGDLKKAKESFQQALDLVSNNVSAEDWLIRDLRNHLSRVRNRLEEAC